MKKALKKKLTKDFWTELVRLCRKHNVTWLEIESIWLNNKKYKAVYDRESSGLVEKKFMWEELTIIKYDDKKTIDCLKEIK